jgi:nicastrin
MSGAVALLAAAHSLAKVENKTGFPKQILFTFFTGESWGYLGSKRFVHDIQYFHCNEVDGDRCHSPYQPSLQFQKIKLDKISSIIELNQVGKPQGTPFTSYPPCIHVVHAHRQDTVCTQ